MTVFGNGLKNKSRVKFKDLRHGVADKIYQQLRVRVKRGNFLLLDIGEYKTSKTCNSKISYEKSNV
ncbi:hypothetical protein BD408DRAFT_410072 [Parasitella parasitica]|nr:hypothetical protein BD408DRAFT_410072 [Parasitella parasitica]